MPPRSTFECNPLSCAYPESDKDLFLQASNTSSLSPHRTVLLYWVNTVFDDGEEVWQVVRLHRREHDGAHNLFLDGMAAQLEHASITAYSLGRPWVSSPRVQLTALVVDSMIHIHSLAPYHQGAFFRPREKGRTLSEPGMVI